MDDVPRALAIRPPVERVEPDAILDNPPPLRGEYDPDAEERVRRQAIQRAAIAVENLPYHVNAVTQALVALGEELQRRIDAFWRSPAMVEIAGTLRAMQDANAATTPTTARDRATRRAQARSRRSGASVRQRRPRRR